MTRLVYASKGSKYPGLLLHFNCVVFAPSLVSSLLQDTSIPFSIEIVEKPTRIHQEQT